MGTRHRATRRLILASSVLALLGVAAVLLHGANTLPPLTDRSESTAYSDTGRTRLGLSFAAGIEAHPGLSGIHALADARVRMSSLVIIKRPFVAMDGTL